MRFIDRTYVRESEVRNVSASLDKGLNKLHRTLYKEIAETSRPTLYILHTKLQVNVNVVKNHLTQMVNIGLLGKVRFKSRSRHYYEVTDMTLEEATLKLVDINKPLPDPLLDKAITFELSDAQWCYIKANPTLSRSVVAKELGIQKVVLNAAIARRKDREGKKA